MLHWPLKDAIFCFTQIFMATKTLVFCDSDKDGRRLWKVQVCEKTQPITEEPKKSTAKLRSHWMQFIWITPWFECCPQTCTMLSEFKYWNFCEEFASRQPIRDSALACAVFNDEIQMPSTNQTWRGIWNFSYFHRDNNTKILYLYF